MSSNDTVLETMKRSISVAEECRDDCISVTYDLAIAKSATQIQSMLEPRFNRQFVNYGAFHIMFRYLGCLGYIIDGSGGPHILVESGALCFWFFKWFYHC